MRTAFQTMAVAVGALAAVGGALAVRAGAPEAIPASSGGPVAVPAGAPGAEAEPPPKAAEPAPPDDLRSLNLTDLQRRVLEQVFHRHPFEAPPVPRPGAAFSVKVEPRVAGGLYRFGPEGDLPARLAVTAVVAGRPVAVRLRYYVEDFYGRKVAEGMLPEVLFDAAGMAAADLVLKEVSAFGYYHVIVTGMLDPPDAGGVPQTATGACGLAVVHAPGEGPDPGGPFGLAAPRAGNMDGLPEVCRRLGVAHLSFYWDDGRAVALHAAPGKSARERWNEGESALKPVLDAGIAATGLVLIEPRYEFPSPPVLVQAQAEAVKHYADRVRDWHIAPAFGAASLWGAGGFGAASAGGSPAFGSSVRPHAEVTAQAVSAYRESVRGLISAVRREEAPVTLAVAATPADLVNILTEGPVLAGADAVSLCVDAEAAAPNLRSGAYRRTIDYALQVARRAGVKGLVVGETGDDPDIQTPQQQAWKLVTRHVLALAAGAGRVYAAYGRGVPEPLPSAAAYAWMTHLLSGAAYQESAWGDLPLAHAHVFSGPERRVAVVWSWAGDDPDVPDRGALVFDDGSRLDAYDVVGHRVGIWKGERLIVPLGEAPVYIVSAELKAGEMSDRLRRARIFGVAPATLWVRQVAPADGAGRMRATLWVQNQRPHRAEVMAGFLLPPGWKSRPTKQQFGLDGGQAREVLFEFDAAASDASPRPYALQMAATVDDELARREQRVWPTVIPERTIEVGYGLGDWAGIEPVVLSSATGDVRAEVCAAWDARFFYFAAAVRRDRARFRGGPLPTDGDAVQLAWGLADRADDDFGARGRDRAFPSGAMRDTDHLVAVTFGEGGAQVIRLRQPRVALRDRVPGNLDSWFGPVEDAAADISRDAASGVTIFEAAVPIAALAPLRGERGRRLRFGFRIGDAGRPPLEWAREAAVPDFLAGPGSFLPMSYGGGLPCQALWTLTGPAPDGKK